MSAGFDKREFRAIEKMLKRAPKEITLEVRKAWNKEGTKRIRAMRKVGYTSRSATSVARGLGGKYGHLKSSLKKKVKFVGGGLKRFGGFLRIEYKFPFTRKRRPKKNPGKRFVGFLHEFGTIHMPARAPLEHSWEKTKGELNIVKVTDKGIAAGIERAARAA